MAWILQSRKSAVSLCFRDWKKNEQVLTCRRRSNIILLKAQLLQYCFFKIHEPNAYTAFLLPRNFFASTTYVRQALRTRTKNQKILFLPFYKSTTFAPNYFPDTRYNDRFFEESNKID